MPQTHSTSHPLGEKDKIVQNSSLGLGQDNTIPKRKWRETKVQHYQGNMTQLHDQATNFSRVIFNPETCRRLTFLETEEGDGTDAKRSRSFSRVLLVLLFAIEQATGASRKKDRIKYSTAMKTCLCETRSRHRKTTGFGPGSLDRVFKRGLTPHSHKCSGVGYSQSEGSRNSDLKATPEPQLASSWLLEG